MSQEPLTQAFCLDESVTGLAAFPHPCLVFHALYSIMATLYQSVSCVSRKRLRSSLAASDVRLARLSNLTVFAFLHLTVSLCLAVSLSYFPLLLSHFLLSSLSFN